MDLWGCVLQNVNNSLLNPTYFELLKTTSTTAYLPRNRPHCRPRPWLRSRQTCDDIGRQYHHRRAQPWQAYRVLPAFRAPTTAAWFSSRSKSSPVGNACKQKFGSLIQLSSKHFSPTSRTSPAKTFDQIVKLAKEEHNPGLNSPTASRLCRHYPASHVVRSSKYASSVVEPASLLSIFATSHEMLPSR